MTTFGAPFSLLRPICKLVSNEKESPPLSKRLVSGITQSVSYAHRLVAVEANRPRRSPITRWRDHNAPRLRSSEWSHVHSRLRSGGLSIAMERRHAIGRGSLIVLDWICETGVPTYEQRRDFLSTFIETERLSLGEWPSFPKNAVLTPPSIRDNGTAALAFYRGAGVRTEPRRCHPEPAKDLTRRSRRSFQSARNRDGRLIGRRCQLRER